MIVVLFHLETVSGVSFGPLDPLVHGGDTGVFVKDLMIAFGPWLGVVLTVMASAVSWWLVERPILARVHEWTALRARRAAHAAERPVPAVAP